MSAHKYMFAILFGAFFLFVMSDVLRIWFAYDKIAKALSQSVDAGLIQGTDESTLNLGKLQINLNDAQSGIISVLKSNLRLDNALESDVYTGSQLSVQMTYMNGIPRLEATFSTHISLIAGKMFGYTAYPMQINKRTPYLMNYK